MSADLPTRLLVVDDHRVVRAGLSALLAQEPDFEVVAQAGNREEAVARWKEARPDVTLMDLHLPVKGGVEAIEEIRACDAGAVVVVLSTYDGDEDVFTALRAGARGYLLKDSEPAELFAAIRRARRGDLTIASEIATKLADRLQVDPLTPRELEIIELVVRGNSNKAIARALDLSEGTVKSHVKRILGKLDATSRTEAAAIARRRGIVHL